MAERTLEGWKKPIPISDCMQIIGEPIVSQKQKDRLLKQQDNAGFGGASLRARVRMTFAGLPTKNAAVYLPDEMFKGAQSFISPYAKPILLHHDERKDPIGRVIDVRYVDTTNQAVQVDSRAAEVMSVFRDKKSSKKSKLAVVNLFQELQSNTDYRGVGYIEGLWEVTDPDAIQKILDGRYHTVSTTFMPEGAHCSTCALEGKLTDWKNEWCDHDRGDFYDGAQCLAVPFGFDYEEVSPVNIPAAPHAQILEFGENLAFADAASRTPITVPYSVFSDAVLVRGDKGWRFSDSAEVEVPKTLSKNRDSVAQDAENNREKTPQQDGASVIGNNETGGDSSSQGKTMKLADLLKDTQSNYEEIAKFLPEGTAKLTGALLGELEDSVFVGMNRTFPCKDEAHAQAALSLLEKIEDGETKTQLVGMVQDRLSKLQVDTGEDAEQDASEEEGESDAAEGEESESDNTDLEKLLAEQGLSSIKTEELKELREKASKVEDLSMAGELLKKQVDSLKTEVTQLESVNKSLMQDQKNLIIEQLVDMQEKAGMKFSDRKAQVKNLETRSVQSLRDSLADFGQFQGDGTARKPDGGRVEHPTKTDKETDSASGQSTGDPSDREKYKDIIDNYFDVLYGPGGKRAADAYLLKQKSLGYLPAHIDP